MNNKDNDSIFNFLEKNLPFIAIAGAICGTIDFEANSVTDSVFEALLTPIGWAFMFVLVSVLISVALMVANLLLDTENKRIWGAGIIIVFLTAVCIKRVL